MKKINVIEIHQRFYVISALLGVVIILKNHASIKSEMGKSNGYYLTSKKNNFSFGTQKKIQINT
ncbi:hypothetical protein QR98_0042530 [Sarcoptes scabiei]|uniref:Uncharacterized protein n=1 Tax=Sarcoptes scabiei TaxID=52283 RepID=A0A132A4A2_SARSC|nr:hypothetical protein QR98_0042530 [Sarcoptes scabiei]